ncbi:MAG: RdgB/HAM1 family non-canonical purine NTP pyrophosphatase [Thermoleophilaceae bacterium]|nr:RdgB/HAM1 family non-canonical purine NTP pyrophosphatase [Thermoleophilaceae bacterium]
MSVAASPRRFVLATRNAHKLREFSGMLPNCELLALPDDVELPPEEGTTFAENALGKARAAAAATGMAAIADDSGICATALDGEPGVWSARYGGEGATDEDNLNKLISELQAHEDKSVEYVCVIALVEPDGAETCFEGRCGGKITHSPRGEGGFGYDPAVVPDDYEDGRTMAELSQPEKDAISHRGRAAERFVHWLDTRPVL